MRTYLLHSMGETFGPFGFDHVSRRLAAAELRPHQQVTIVEDGVTAAGSVHLEDLAEFRTVVLQSRPTVVGHLDGTMAILQSDGSAACFVDGEWRPGIVFDSRDFLEMSRIESPERVQQLLGEAADALARSRER